MKRVMWGVVAAAGLAALEHNPSLGDIAGLLDRGKEFGIMIIFETHTGDLSGLDLVALSSLSTPEGDLAPERWISEGDSSHHRSGVLVFESEGLELDSDGELKLAMHDVGGVSFP